MPEYENIENLNREVKQVFDIYIRLVAEQFVGDLSNRALKEAKDPTGALAQSWFLREAGEYEYLALSNKEYAFVVSEGSEGPYDIYPREAQALRFTMDGNVVFAQHVVHPGIEGNEYIEKAIEDTEERLDELADVAARKAGVEWQS